MPSRTALAGAMLLAGTAFVPAALPLVAGQRAAAETAALRKYRYGLSAAQIVDMGYDAFSRRFEAKTPDGSTGVMRGVAYGVYVDAKRETNAALRAKLPATERTRLVALDRQLRFFGVLVARNDWLFTGGNAVDPEGDTIEMANAETDLLRRKRVARPALAPLGAIDRYGSRIVARAQAGPMDGALKGGPDRVRENVAKMRAAARRALALAKGARERDLVARYLVDALGR